MHFTRLQFFGTALFLSAVLWLSMMWCGWLPKLSFLPKEQEPVIGFLTALAGVFSFAYGWYQKARQYNPDSGGLVSVLRKPFRRDIDMEKSRKAMLSRMEKRCLDLLPNADNFIDLKFASAPTMLAPRKSVERNRREQTSLNTQVISKIFDLSEHRLLILGEPGAGKTTILYELAQELCALARVEPERPVPLVVNLSTWGKTEAHNDFRVWLTDQLQVAYDIQPVIIEAGLQSNYFTLLLDGFDEVPREKREQCAIAINQFAGADFERQIAVCSRITEYEMLKNKFSKLEYAVVIQALAREQIIEYFQAADKFELQVAYEESPTLQEVIKTPLMAEVAVRASESMTDETIFSWQEDEKKVKDQLWKAYLKYALGKKKVKEDEKGEALYAEGDVSWWIGWLAKTMKKFDITDFYLERMQPAFLSKGKMDGFRVLDNISMALIIAILVCFMAGLGRGIAVFVAIVCMVPLELFLSIFLFKKVARFLSAAIPIGILVGNSEFFHGTISGITGGVFIGSMFVFVLGQMDDEYWIIWPAERIDWNFSLSTLWYSILLGTIIALITGLGFGITSFLALGSTAGIAVGVSLGLSMGIAVALGYLLKSSILNENDFQRPNEGIYRSGKNAIWMAIPGLILMICSWIFKDKLHQPIFGQSNLHIHSVLMIFGYALVLILSISQGFIAFARHYILRRLLRKSNYIPPDYVKFLDYACRLGLLKHIGTGYTFYHRELREYIATRWRDAESMSE